jgi:glutaredoxin
MRRIVLYTREGCCLCEEARKVLEAVHGRHPAAFAWSELDIDSDDRLHRAYLERIPVVTIDGEEAFELFLDESELEQRLGIVGSG